ncbi:hypothetical protein Q1M62_04485 (plasmid) [Sinorhizobium meliloti]|nr:hypothetical protein LZK74_05855 [Sinorhizobium meliloti]WKL34265.1 hypothetical protein Q1M62_04485 [Sinorhizobium meliloti]
MQAIQLLQIGHLELSGALGRRHRRRPQEDRCRYRQAHGRKISRSDEHPSSVQGRREKRALPRATGLGGMPATRKYARAGGSGAPGARLRHQPPGFLGRSLLFPRGGKALAFTAAKHMRQKFCRSRSRGRPKKKPLPRAARTASSPLQRPLGVSSPGHKGFHARRQFVERFLTRDNRPYDTVRSPCRLSDTSCSLNHLVNFQI